MTMGNDGDLQGNGLVHADVPEDELELGPVSGSPPGTEEVLVSMGQGQASLPMVLMTGSEKPAEYLLRGRLTEQDVHAIIEMMGDYNEVFTGDTDIMGIIALKANATAGMNGMARKEAIQATSGGMFDPITNTFRRFVGSRRRNYNSGFNGQQRGVN